MPRRSHRLDNCEPPIDEPYDEPWPDPWSRERLEMHRRLGWLDPPDPRADDDLRRRCDAILSQCRALRMRRL